MVTNRRTVATEGADFYATPHWATEALLDQETFSGEVWEPCCGEGDISMVLKKRGCLVHSSDLFDRGYGTQEDAFNVTKRYDNIITNPPFNIAEDLLNHFLSLYDKKIALLVRTAFLESKKRYSIFKENPPARVFVFSQRVSMYPKGYEIKSGGTTSYSWIIWDKSEKSGNTQLKWIPPVYNNR